MGPIKEGINEIIATTTGNAAPMGIISRKDTLQMAVYLTSHTARNIERDGWVIAHITTDPLLFVTTAFSDLPEDAYTDEIINGIRMQRLTGVDDWIAFSATVVNRTPRKILVSLTPLKEHMTRAIPSAYNRGLANLIEATVHGTRYRYTGSEILKKLIIHHIALVERCGGERELEALSLLRNFLEL